MSVEKWTNKALLEEAIKYSTKKDFRENSNSAYVISLRNNILDEICSHMEVKRKCHTYEEASLEAKKYINRKEFNNANPSAYNHLVNSNRYYEACAHFHVQKNYSYNDVKQEALKYASRTEFKNNSQSHYYKAIRKNYLDDVCRHMAKQSGASDNNVFYIWKAKDKKDLYKIGITSSKSKNRRIRDVGYSSKYIPEIIIVIDTSNAKSIEKKVLSIGKKIDSERFNGYTEFRTMTKKELQKAIMIAIDNK